MTAPPAAAGAVRRRRALIFGPLAVVAAAASGAMIFCAFPAPTIAWLLWVGLIPLLMALDATRSTPAAFALGWIAGTVTNFGGFYWMSHMLREFGHLPPAAAWAVTGLNAAWQGLVFALFAAAYVRLRTPGLLFRVVTAPALMILAEASVPYVFPWFLGNGLQPQIEVFQIVEILGVEAASGWVVAVNGAAAWGLRTAAVARRPPFAAAICIAALYGSAWQFGAWRLSHVDAVAEASETLSAGMVEANIGIWEKQARHMSRAEARVAKRGNLLTHQRLSAEAVAAGAEFVVWPESSYVPSRATGIKRTDVFGLVRTTDDRLFVRLGDGRLVTPSELDGGSDLTGVDGRIRAVVGGREDTALVLARAGRIFRLDANGWREELSGVGLNLNAAWAGTESRHQRDLLRAGIEYCRHAAGPCDLPAVAVGEGGLYLRRINAQWQRANAPTGADLLAVDGLSSRELLAVGTEGVILRDDGSQLVAVRERGPTLRDVALHPTGRAAAVGDDCAILVRPPAGDFVTASLEGCDQRLRAVAFLADGRLVAGGRDGALVYEESPGGPLRHRALDGAPYVRGLTADPRGRVVAALEDGRLLAVDDPAAPSLPTALDLGVPIYRYASVGWLFDAAIPDDARHVYASDVPLPTGPDTTARVLADQAIAGLDRDAVQRGFDAPLLFGAVSYDAEEVLTNDEPIIDHLQNTALLLDRGGAVLGMSHKIRLLIFGEYLPFEELLPQLRELVPEAGRFVAGEAMRPLTLPRPEGEPVRLAPLVCYEDILPAFSPIIRAAQADLMVNLTNDAWFGRTSEPALHLQLAAARSVETRRAMVRSTNTGISAFIDPAGRILDATDLDHAETRVRSVPLMRLTSFHGVTARSLYWGAILWALLLLLGDLLRTAPRQRRRGRR